MDTYRILQKLSIPRPNHSRALNATRDYLVDLLTQWGIDYDIQEFALRPFKQLLVGLAILACSIGYCFLVFREFWIYATILAVLIPLVLILEFEFFLPLVSFLYQRKGENLIVPFKKTGATSELIISAHYDSNCYQIHAEQDYNFVINWNKSFFVSIISKIFHRLYIGR